MPSWLSSGRLNVILLLLHLFLFLLHLLLLLLPLLLLLLPLLLLHLFPLSFLLLFFIGCSYKNGSKTRECVRNETAGDSWEVRQIISSSTSPSPPPPPPLSPRSSTNFLTALHLETVVILVSSTIPLMFHTLLLLLPPPPPGLYYHDPEITPPVKASTATVQQINSWTHSHVGLRPGQWWRDR